MYLETAQEEALRLVDILKPHTKQIHIAGSVRRLKREVKDIEILVEPALTEQSSGLLFDDGPKKLIRHPLFTQTVKALGVIEKGSPSDGRYVSIMLPIGVKLDLFIPRPEDYFRQYAIRTGSADWVTKNIAGKWVKHGWCGCGDLGLRKMSDCIQKDNGSGGKFWICLNKNGTVPPAWTSEEDFFNWLNLKWIIPPNRNI